MTTNGLLTEALRIANAWHERGYQLTLRQLYYRLVAEGLLDSGQDHYKRLGRVLTAARYAGDFPIDWIEDRGRDVNHAQATRTANVGLLDDFEAQAHRIIGRLPEFLVQRDRWLGQPVHVSVWVEKQALEGVFQGPCEELGVSWFACKGYPSVSALYEWLKEAYFVVRGEHPDPAHRLSARRDYHFQNDIEWTEVHAGTARECRVLYFGDHDPDGWEIPRTAESALRQLMATYNMAVPLSFERVALNMDQIRRYDPPSFGAKVTSTRYARYIKEHGTDGAWELDALDPDVLQQLISDHVEELFDGSIQAANDRAVQAIRTRLAHSLGVAGGR